MKSVRLSTKLPTMSTMTILRTTSWRLQLRSSSYSEAEENIEEENMERVEDLILSPDLPLTGGALSLIF